MLRHHPSCRRGECIGCIGHQGYLRRLSHQHQIDKIFAWVAFNVEFRAKERSQCKHIVVLDMSLIGARVHSDAIGAESLAIHSHRFHIRHITATCIAQCGHFIDIYT